MVDLRKDALAVIAECRIMTLATGGAHGPWAAAVFYASDGFDLVFVSSPESRHVGDLALDPRCAVALHPEPSDWRDIRGVQMAGTAAPLHGAERAAAMARYARRFPFADPRQAPEAIRAALDRVGWYRFHPESAHLVDNRRGFGRRAVPLG